MINCNHLNNGNCIFIENSIFILFTNINILFSSTILNNNHLIYILNSNLFINNINAENINDSMNNDNNKSIIYWQRINDIISSSSSSYIIQINSSNFSFINSIIPISIINITNNDNLYLFKNKFKQIYQFSIMIKYFKDTINNIYFEKNIWKNNDNLYTNNSLIKIENIKVDDDDMNCNNNSIIMYDNILIDNNLRSFLNVIQCLNLIFNKFHVINDSFYDLYLLIHTLSNKWNNIKIYNSLFQQNLNKLFIIQNQTKFSIFNSKIDQHSNGMIFNTNNIMLIQWYLIQILPSILSPIF